MAQACLVDEFLNPDAKKTNLTDFMKHLLHMVEVAGIDHVLSLIHIYFFSSQHIQQRTCLA